MLVLVQDALYFGSLQLICEVDTALSAVLGRNRGGSSNGRAVQPSCILNRYPLWTELQMQVELQVLNLFTF